MAIPVRSPAKIASDISTDKEINRQDVYEVLKNTPGKTNFEKREAVASFLRTLPTGIINKKDTQGAKKIDKILDDLNSYPL